MDVGGQTDGQLEDGGDAALETDRGRLVQMGTEGGRQLFVELHGELGPVIALLGRILKFRETIDGGETPGRDLGQQRLFFVEGVGRRCHPA